MRSLRSINAAFFARSRALRGAPPEGVPPPFGRLPLPLQKPPRGGWSGPPRGGGVPPPCPAFRPPLRPPGGTPDGVPPASPAPPPVSVRQRKGLASEARRGGSPGEGLEKKSKLRRRSRPQAAGSGNVGKAGQPVGRGGGSRWATPRVVHGVSLPLSTGREAPAGRAAISTSPLPGGPTRPPLGACSAPQGSRLPFRKSSEYTCLSSGPPEARF